MANKSITKLVEHGDRMRNRLKRIELDGKRGEGIVLGLGGVALGVFADARFGEGAADLEIAGIPAVMAVAAVGVGLGLSRKVPQAERVLELAKGPLYYTVGVYLRRKFEEEAAG